jgi:hypothetical protein
VYGGAAGGGKTWALLIEAARNIMVPGFGGVIFRRSMPEITAEGALWDEAAKLYPRIGGQSRKSPALSYIFPRSTKIEFRHLQHDETVLDWQGSQIPFIGFDELTHFTAKQFWYMLSRNRSMCGVKPYIRATTNPAPGWVKEFLSPWLSPDHPMKAESGELRYFIRRSGEVVWVDGSYRDDEGLPPKSVTFIKSSVYDNKILLSVNPEYLVNLKSLPLVEQERLLRGNWNVFEGAFYAEFAEHRHCEPVEFTPPSGANPVPKHWNYGAGADWGYNAPFSFHLDAVDESGNVHVLDELCLRGLENHEQALRIIGKLKEWGLSPADVPIYCDPSMWAKKRSNNGGIPKSDIEDWQRLGLRCIAGNNNRRHGHSQVRYFLQKEGAYKINKSRCPQLVKDFIEAKYSETDPEDMDTTGSDHTLDDQRYYLCSRPRPALEPVEAPVPGTYAAKRAQQKKQAARRKL